VKRSVRGSDKKCDSAILVSLHWGPLGERRPLRQYPGNEPVQKRHHGQRRERLTSTAGAQGLRPEQL
jgi:hypothetical protein